MFNLLIDSDSFDWKKKKHSFSSSRVAVEYTEDSISERYKKFTKDSLNELKRLPTLFVTEREKNESRIGYITNINVDDNHVNIAFEVDNDMPLISKGDIEKIGKDLELGEYELYRTHWAIKQGSLDEILLKNGLITKDHYNFFQKEVYQLYPLPKKHNSKQQIFIVHGRDETTLTTVVEYIKGLELSPIVLKNEPSASKSIIEKLECFINDKNYKGVKFGIILYTECDIGYKKYNLERKYRARQNVVFEHGFLIGALGRNKTVMLSKGNEIEFPSDVDSILRINLDKDGNWRNDLNRELLNAGYTLPNLT